MKHIKNGLFKITNLVKDNTDGVFKDHPNTSVRDATLIKANWRHVAVPIPNNLINNYIIITWR